MDVEFFESPNDFIINVEWQLLIELVRSNPCDVLTHNFYLIVYSFNAEKGFLEGLGDSAVGHPFFVESICHLDILRVDFESLMLREVGEQGKQAQSIVKVS